MPSCAYLSRSHSSRPSLLLVSLTPPTFCYPEMVKDGSQSVRLSATGLRRGLAVYEGNTSHSCLRHDSTKRAIDRQAPVVKCSLATCSRHARVFSAILHRIIIRPSDIKRTSSIEGSCPSANGTIGRRGLRLTGSVACWNCQSNQACVREVSRLMNLPGRL